MNLDTIEDLYQLSPLQAGMLVHELRSPDRELYGVQVTCRITGPLAPGLFRQAWRRVIARHPILRTAFLSDRLEQPVQVVHREVVLPWREEDLRGAADQDGRLEELLADDHSRRFPLDRAPLTRITLVRLGETDHQLVWSFHHLLLDGWSMPLVLQEALACYAALVGGSAPASPAVRPYRDYIAWLGKQDTAAAERFWKGELAGLERPTALGADRAATSESPRFAEHHCALTEAETVAVRSFARDHKLTVNTLTQGAWAILLSRYSGERDVVFGATVALRPAEIDGVEAMVGPLINTLPVRARLEGAARSADWLADLQAAQNRARRYAYASLADVQSWSGLPAGSPLFESLLVFENYPREPDSDGRSKIGGQPLTVHAPRVSEWTNYPLTIVARDGGGLSFKLLYDENRLDRETVERLGRHLRGMLTAIAADPGARPADLVYWPAAERELVLSDWNVTPSAYAGPRVVHELVAEQARAKASAVAVSCQGRSLTYGELDRRANGVANELAARGVGVEHLVGVCLPRDVELPVVLLGVLKAGAAYLPLDPGYPLPRLTYMVEDAAPTVIVTTAELAGGLPEHPNVVLLDELAGAGETAPEVTVRPDNLVYLMYTSGSTGRPKGVAVTHTSVTRLVKEASYARLAADEVFLHLAPLAFDASTLEVWGALANGARLALFPGTRPALGEIGEVIAAEGVTTLWLSAGLFHRMVEERLDDLRPLRQLLAGGEALSPAHVRRALDALPGCAIINGYGPTEATTFTSCHRVEEVGDTSVPIGTPISDTYVYVLDEVMAPVPVGVAGELFVGGPGLARGYWGRPGLTAERFVPDPFGSFPTSKGGRLYRTGDRVRWLPDGTLEFLGRLDDQVKLRGFRIELGEIEAALRQRPGVTAALVLMRKAASGDNQLVGYVTADEGVTGPELRAALAEELPDYMVPAAVVVLPEWPLTANGKVDRAALPEPAAYHGDYRPPADPVEELLAGVFAGVLGLARVGVDDDFFLCGGNSLMVTRLVARVRDAFGVEVPVRTVFQAPTVAGLAGCVREVLAGFGRVELAPVVPVADRGRLPLSFAQQRLWFLDQLQGDLAVYNVPLVVRLRGALEVVALGAALGAVVARHESLRVCFPVVDGEPFQRVAVEASVPFPVCDLTGRGERLGEVVDAEVGRPFDLAAGPVVRALLVRLADDDHVLVVTAHHSVADGWSLGVLHHELAVYYNAAVAGEAPRLGELAVQYGDFAVWQRERLTDEVLEPHLDYWREKLAGAAQLELPSDRPRPAVTTYRGSIGQFFFPSELLDGLRRVGREEGATLFMTLLAAFQALLGRYSGQGDISVGTPVAGRGRPELDGLIGFFVNTLVLRGDLSGDPSFRELLARTRQVALEAYTHQDVPFERLVDAVAGVRDPSRSPLFQVMFALQNTPGERPVLDGLTSELLQPQTTASKFDLTVSVEETPGGLAGVVEYSTDLFDRGTVERLVGHYERLLEGVAADPDARVSEISLLSEAEQRRLAGWNATDRRYAGPELLHELVAAQVRATPDVVAVSAGDGPLTYAELDRRANRLANLLQARGVGVDHLVAVCLPRDLGLPVAQFAALKAGAAYVPIDPGLPHARLSFMFADAAPTVVVTTSELAPSLPYHPGMLVLDDPEVRAELTAAAETAPSVSVHPDNLAYLIYTSGSTGKPKAVALPHRGIVNLVHWHCETFGVTPADRASLVAGLGFDAATWELWPYLAAGGRVCLPPEDVRLSAEPLQRWLVDQGVTMAFLPTPMAEQALRLDWPAECALRVLLTGGAALRRHPPAGLPFTLINNYGPTEASVAVTSGAVPAVDAVPALNVSVPPSLGGPIGNARLYVLDEVMAPVPVGVAGELFVGGPGLARGYWGRPGLTAERFVPDPFGSLPTSKGGRLYRTGDRVRWLPDGTLEFLGRLDDQVKLRGFRIELGEIEAVLLAHPAVRQAVVTVASRTPDDQYLAAYVVGDAPGRRELRAHLAEHLPEHMIPVITTLPSLPLTPNGKVDRAALPAPDLDAVTGQTPYTAPRDEIEAQLAGVFAGVLGLARVGVDDDFFLCGGNSLMVTRLVARVRDAFGVEVPVRTVFQAPTVAGLAGCVREVLAGFGRVELAPVVPVADRGRLPLSFAQQRLWFLDQLQGDLAVYNVPLVVRLRGALEVPALEAALGAVVARHESLRVCFPVVDGEPFQRVAVEASVPFPVCDLTGRGERLGEVVDAEVGRPFDLAAGPVVRALLVRLADDDHVLVVTAHHSVADGWSLGVLHHELAVYYNAAVAGEAPRLGELAVQYGDFAVWQRERLTDEVLEPHLAYWREKLTGAAQLELPSDRPRPAVATYRGAVERFAFPAPLLDGLRQVGREQGATLFMTLLAAFQALLGRYSGQGDISVGTPVAGRGRPELDGLIGFFVNTLVLRGDLSGDPSFRELLARTRQVALEAYTHQDVPFERLVDAVAGVRDPSRSPLFQVMFALQNTPGERPVLDGLTSELLQPQTTASKFDLTVSVEETPGGLAGVVEYSTDLFDRGTVERLVGHYERLLEGVAADPDARVSEISLLSEAEQRQLAGWNATDRRYAGPELLHELVAAQVRATPDVVAVSAGDGSLTYAELDRRANRLANLLQARGVGVEHLVGVCLPRAIDLPVALLAVLKAGGAYVPLDPGYPRSRLAYMFADAAPTVVVTTSELAPSLPYHPAMLVLDDPEVRAELTAAAETAPSVSVHPDNLAYLIYTSGSTGRPKGAMNSHAAIRNRLLWMQEEYGLDETDRVLQKTPMSFDVSVWEFFWPLITGARMVLARPEGHKDPEYLRDTIIKEGVTTLHFVPPMLQIFLDQPGVEDCRSIRRVVCSGQALPAELSNRFLSRLDAGLHNLYGPTEAAVDVSYWPCDMGDDIVPIGRPIANIRLHVVDATMRRVPIGVPGELLIGGIGVGRGYKDRPSLTAERFVPDPFGSLPTSKGGRLYRTGDRVRWLPDGTLEFLGRLDDQVKLRGFRIELGEIEAVLLGHPAVRQAVVTVASRTPDDQYLAAYVVGDAPGRRELRAHLAEHLPEHMIPVITTLPSLPLTPNGKVDRAALPAPDLDAVTGQTPYTAPRDEIETRLVDIWRETLDIAQVGMNDNFFDLGGHSLLLPVVRERIRVDFGRDIAMLELFRRPTPRALADLLVNGSGESSAVAKDGTHRDARERALRQRRLRMRRES